MEIRQDIVTAQPIARADANTLLFEQEAALRATRQNLTAIYEASGDGLALCEAIFDADGHMIDYQALEVNRAHAELTDASREVMLTKRISVIYPPVDPRWFQTAEAVLTTGEMQTFDIRSRATGRWLNIRVSRVSDTLFQQTFVDVSDRHLLEEQRQMLLKEMSHRVMNNFQMIASFLNIQAKGADAATRAHLATVEQRVQVLATLHSLLTYTESDRFIDAGAYVRELCGHLGSTFDRPDAISLVCEADELLLPTDKVVPLGFIISELVSNSAKHGYPAPATGVVSVTLAAQADGWTVVIKDSGRGFSGRTEEASGGRSGNALSGKGMGTRMVNLFVKQIGAELTSTWDAGVCHRIVRRETG